MTQAKMRFTTIAEYASLDPSELPEGHYELVNGEIIELPAESDPNVEIAMFLTAMLAQVTAPRLIRRGTEIFVSSRTVTSRFPDLIVLSETGRAALKGARRSAITSDMPAPRLVIEVVSPGDQNYQRDYIQKRAEYASRGIPEYWLIDREHAVITVLSLEGEQYREVGQFGDRGNQGSNESQRIISPTFPDLQLTVAQILAVE
jgi:Uma2 family endonuclease